MEATRVRPGGPSPLSFSIDSHGSARLHCQQFQRDAGVQAEPVAPRQDSGGRLGTFLNPTAVAAARSGPCGVAQPNALRTAFCPFRPPWIWRPAGRASVPGLRLFAAVNSFAVEVPVVESRRP